jgi:arginine/lysine/ornithine decarboxylase
MSKVPQGILESLTRYIRENPIRMHMPGHKGMTTRPVQEMPGKVLEAVKALDITEVPGMDNLHYPRGAIRATERALSRAFGTSRTHCLVNGATSGILASLLAIRMTLGKGRIIVPRNAHRSIVSGLVLSGLEPLFVYPEYDASLGGYLPLQVSDIKKQLKGWPSNGRCSLAGRIKDIRGMVLVNPTYFGMARDTSGLCLLAGEMGIPVVADEAHGTLFPFSGRFPPSAIGTGASLVVHGVHKTSKAFTQTGLLHVAQTCTDMFPGLAENVQEALRLVQSTSPSYLLLASLERAMEDFSQDSEWVQTVVESGRGLASRLSRIQGLEVRVPWEGTEPNGDTARPGRDRGFLWDPGKILVGVSALGITGPQAQAILWEKNRVVPEMVGFDYVLLMVTGSDTSSTIERVVRGFEALSNECLGPGATVAALQYSRPLPGEREGCKFFTKTLEQEPPRAKRVMSLSQAFYSNSRPFSLRDSIGKICADTIFIYPPGSPIVVPGERIDDAIVKYLNAAMKCGLEVLGRGYSDYQREMKVFCVEQ